MNRGWNVLCTLHGEVVIRFLDGEILVIKINGHSGFGFVTEYLETMNMHYKGQLIASDEILRIVLGKRYKNIRKIQQIYQTYLVIISLSCAFGTLGEKPHFDSCGNFHFTYTPCPLQTICPFNGFKNNLNSKGPFGCNPIYETALSSRMVEVANMLVTSPKELSEIADILHLTEGRTRNIASEIYSAMGVKNRMELTLLLKDKRIM